jgi:hypothetical protein
MNLDDVGNDALQGRLKTTFRLDRHRARSHRARHEALGLASLPNKGGGCCGLGGPMVVTINFNRHDRTPSLIFRIVVSVVRIT